MPAPRSAAAREEWELLAAEGEWLRAATAQRFAPWPLTEADRARFRGMLRAHGEALAAWRKRHFGKPDLA